MANYGDCGLVLRSPFRGGSIGPPACPSEALHHSPYQPQRNTEARQTKGPSPVSRRQGQSRQEPRVPRWPACIAAGLGPPLRVSISSSQAKRLWQPRPPGWTKNEHSCELWLVLTEYFPRAEPSALLPQQSER